MRLLIVDDDELTCRGMQARIQMMRFPQLQAVDIAFSAEEALSFAQAYRVDILLTDVKMVDMNGVELSREVKKANPLLCSIIMTAYANFEYAHQAIKLGVLDFLLKPFSKEEMQQTLKKVIEQAASMRGTEEGAQDAEISPASDPIAWAQSYVRKHLDQDINMSLVANKLNLSYSYFSKLFKQQTGQSFSAYITDEKMKMAGNMLKAGKKTHEVAVSLSYHTPQNFNRAFMRYWNCTPGEYRKRAVRAQKGKPSLE